MASFSSIAAFLSSGKTIKPVAHKTGLKDKDGNKYRTKGTPRSLSTKDLTAFVLSQEPDIKGNRPKETAENKMEVTHSVTVSNLDLAVICQVNDKELTEENVEAAKAHVLDMAGLLPPTVLERVQGNATPTEGNGVQV